MATDSQIMFGGNVLPCTVERFPEIKKAARKFRRYNIPGRSGDVIFQDDAWENVTQAYEVFAGSDTYGSQVPWTDLARSLYQTGYQELSDTYDPDHFRKAVYNNQIDVENSWNSHGRATLEFDCRPERFRYDGLSEIFYGYNTSAYQTINYDDLSVGLQGDIVQDTFYYIFTVAAGKTAEVGVFSPTEQYYTEFYGIQTGTETTAAYADFTYSATGKSKTSITNTAIYAIDLLIPKSMVVGVPMVIVDGVGLGAKGVLNNPYMPSHPSLVLHIVNAGYANKPAVQINDKAIYAGGTYTSAMWFFVDTENYTVMEADTRNGERAISSRLRIDPGFALQPGPNQIYTTQYFEMYLTPNWWEL